MTDQSHARHAWQIVAVLLFGGTLLVSACTTSTTSPTTPTSPTSPAVSHTGTPTGATKAECQHIKSLEASLTSLAHVRVSPTSAATLTRDITNIETQLAALKSMGAGQFSAQASMLTADINEVKRAAGQLSTNPIAAIQSLTRALEKLKTTGQPMIAQMRSACP